MPLNLESYLGVHAQALKLHAQRSEVLATNLANADTPNFRARDIDFRAALAAADPKQSSVSLAATSGRHMSTGGPDAVVDLKYRVPLAPSLDGNTVDVQLEQAAFAENTVRYQAALSFLSARFRGLLTAITGQ